jgi:hypothetical protein
MSSFTVPLTAAEALTRLCEIYALGQDEALSALRAAAAAGTWRGPDMDVICNDPNPADPRFTIAGALT